MCVCLVVKFLSGYMVVVVHCNQYILVMITYVQSFNKFVLNKSIIYINHGNEPLFHHGLSTGTLIVSPSGGGGTGLVGTVNLAYLSKS